MITKATYLKMHSAKVKRKGKASSRVHVIVTIFKELCGFEFALTLLR